MTAGPALFAGCRVSDLGQAQPWYEALFGAEPTFFPNDVEAVWELAESRSIYIEQDPSRAGNALHTLFVDDLEALVIGISSRGLKPAESETYSNGVRKVTYRDPDGNEIGYAGQTEPA